MAEMGAITIPLTFGFRESLARELREAADALDPRPPSVTAEDLRGAEAEIDRLRAIIRGDIPDPECKETVQRAAMTIAVYFGASAETWGAWVTEARAILAALAGAR